MKRISIRSRFAACCALVLVAGVAAGPVRVAEATSATSTSVTISPNPVVAGQQATLTATTSAPGSVSFTVDGQVIATGASVGTGASVPNAQRWNYTGNSIATSSTVDSNGNVYVATYNPSDCSGGRCQSKQLTPGGSVNTFANQSWNGTSVFITGMAVTSSGVIYESVGSANKIFRRTSISGSTTEFVNTGLSRPCGLTLDANENLYVANKDSGIIHRITPAGVVSTYASGFTGPCGVVMNKSTGILYVADGNGDISTVPVGGGSSILLVNATCATAWWGGSQLAIDEGGFLYGRDCNGQPVVTQISPTGTMSGYLTTSGSTTPGASQNSPFDIAYSGGSIYVAGAEMGTSSMFRFAPTGYRAVATYTSAVSGSFGVSAAFTPANSAAFASSTGAGTLSVQPVAPQTPDLAGSSDLGSSNSDNLTSDNTPLIQVPGSYQNGNTITVTATRAGSPNVTCSYVIPASGCSLGTLVDGTWSVTATDSHPVSGASSASGVLSIVIDATAPATPTGVDLLTASDTGGSSSDNITGDNTPTLSASGGSNGDVMTMSATNGATTVTCTYVIGVATSCTLGTLSDGTWSVSATLTDSAGNVSAASSALSVVVDTTGPGSLSPDLVTASDTGSSNSDNVTGDNTPTISLTGQSTGDVVTVTASRSGATSVTCTYTVGSASNCTLGTLSDGTWSVSASVVDAAGNSGTTQALSVAIDTTAPSTPSAPDLLASSDLGASSTDNLTSDSSPAVSAGTPENGSTVTLTATRGGAQSVTCTYVASSTISSCDLATLSDGTWSVSAVVTDPAGNASSSGPGLSISIDTVAPAVLSAPQVLLDAEGSTSDSTPNATVPDATSGDTVKITARNGATVVTCTFVASATVRGCDLPNLSPGTWQFTATATDPAGNTSQASTAAPVAVRSTDLPQNVATLDSDAVDTGWVTVTAGLRRSERGRVSHVVFIVRNADGTSARVVRVPVPRSAARVSTRIPSLLPGQRVTTYVESGLGVSSSAPQRVNLKRGRTARGADASGLPVLVGEALVVNRIIFDPASSALDETDRRQLRQFAREIRGKGGLVLVSGFARQNRIDTERFLNNLSLERALEVSRYLSSVGVRAWIRYAGYGAVSQTIGTEEDRKVELRWVNGSSLLPTR